MLAGASTYSGPTSVTTGTLHLAGSLASDITAASDAALAGSGSTSGRITLADGARLVVGGSAVTARGGTVASMTSVGTLASDEAARSHAVAAADRRGGTRPASHSIDTEIGPAK